MTLRVWDERAIKSMDQYTIYALMCGAELLFCKARPDRNASTTASDTTRVLFVLGLFAVAFISSRSGRGFDAVGVSFGAVDNKLVSVSRIL
jgi:hypothetical protein